MYKKFGLQETGLYAFPIQKTGDVYHRIGDIDGVFDVTKEQFARQGDYMINKFFVSPQEKEWLTTYEMNKFNLIHKANINQVDIAPGTTCRRMYIG